MPPCHQTFKKRVPVPGTVHDLIARKMQVLQHSTTRKLNISLLPYLGILQLFSEVWIWLQYGDDLLQVFVVLQPQVPVLLGLIQPGTWTIPMVPKELAFPNSIRTKTRGTKPNNRLKILPLTKRHKKAYRYHSIFPKTKTSKQLSFTDKNLTLRVLTVLDGSWNVLT